MVWDKFSFYLSSTIHINAICCYLFSSMLPVLYNIIYYQYQYIQTVYEKYIIPSVIHRWIAHMISIHYN